MSWLQSAPEEDMASEFKLKLKWRLLLPAGDNCKSNAVNLIILHPRKNFTYYIYSDF